jgi:hypothetical protein
VDGNTKYRFKGINDNAQILTGAEGIIVANPNKEGETIYKVKKGIDQQVNQFYNNNKINSIGENNQVRFFEKIYTEGKAFVLCNSFRKIVKNNKRNVRIDEVDKFNNLMNTIQVKYQVKKIQIQKGSYC